MSQSITITKEDILQQVKLSLKIPEIIDGILTRKVIANAAAKAGIKVETEELQKTADAMRLTNKLINAYDTWAWLKKHSLSLDDFEEIAHTNLTSSKLVTHLFANKIEPLFYENQLEYLGAVMYEVVLDDQDLAMELYYAIQEGEMSFYEVAHQYIQDKKLRRKGGYRGVVYRKDLKPEISAAVFAAAAPQVIKPIITSTGVHLIFVEEMIQPQLDDLLRNKIASDLFNEWINRSLAEFKSVTEIEVSGLTTENVS